MSADLPYPEALTVELKRLKRRASAAILLAVASLGVGAAAVVTPYSPTFRAALDRVLWGRAPAPQSVTADELLAKAGLLLKSQTVENGKTRATLGSAGLETIKTGATQQTAESSLVLFDKEGEVIFEAPR